MQYQDIRRVWGEFINRAKECRSCLDESGGRGGGGGTRLGGEGKGLRYSFRESIDSGCFDHIWFKSPVVAAMVETWQKRRPQSYWPCQVKLKAAALHKQYTTNTTNTRASIDISLQDISSTAYSLVPWTQGPRTWALCSHGNPDHRHMPTPPPPPLLSWLHYQPHPSSHIWPLVLIIHQPNDRAINGNIYPADPPMMSFLGESFITYP